MELTEWKDGVTGPIKHSEPLAVDPHCESLRHCVVPKTQSVPIKIHFRTVQCRNDPNSLDIVLKEYSSIVSENYLTGQCIVFFLYLYTAESLI